MSSLVTEEARRSELFADVPKFLGRWIPAQHRPVAALLFGALRSQRRLVALCLTANLGASVLEGASMGLLYVAVSLFIGSATSMGGGAGEWALGVLQAAREFDRWILFLILVGVLALVQVLQSSLSYAGFATSAVLRMRVKRDLMNAIIRQMMDLSFRSISRYKSGDLWSQVTLGNTVEKLVGILNDGFYTIFMAAAYTVVLFALSWPLTLSALAVFVILSLGLRAVMVRVNANAAVYLDAARDFNSGIASFLSGMRLVRSFGLERASTAIMRQYIDGVSHASMRVNLWQACVSPIIDTVTILTLAGVMLMIGLVFRDRISDVLPTMLVFVFVIARLVPRLGHINRMRAAIHEHLPSATYTVNFLRRDDKEFSRQGGIPFVGLRESIDFKGVCLDYVAGERLAVASLDCRIRNGETVALVGESGAGKSSVVDLLLGLYDPTAGEICADGAPLTTINLESWRQRIGVVSQDAFLFPASIRDNIAFAKPEASLDEIVAAARLAHADDFISRLDSGYDTVIGDRGYRLSGGQCQRIALARAILRNPELLILDEATSQLDSYSEHLIQDALDAFRKGRTVIVVAHRLSTVRSADRILVLHEGRLVEQGRHEELVAKGGTYARLWRLQTDGAVTALRTAAASTGI